MCQNSNEYTSILVLRQAVDIINYRFLTTETNLKALYIFRCLFTTSSVKLFVWMYRFLFTVVFFRKRKNNTHILKMKAHLKKNHILKIKAHSKTHFENENMFLEKWKVSYRSAGSRLQSKILNGFFWNLDFSSQVRYRFLSLSRFRVRLHVVALAFSTFLRVVDSCH